MKNADGSLSAARRGGDWSLYTAVFPCGFFDHHDTMLQNWNYISHSKWVAFNPTGDSTFKVGIFESSVPESDPNWRLTLNGFFGMPNQIIDGVNLAGNLWETEPYKSRPLD